MFKEIFILDSYYFDNTDRDVIILDCGSNIGMAMIYFKIVWPHSRIICIEPDEASYGLVLKNISDNGFTGVTVYNCLVSDVNGSANFFSKGNIPSLKMSVFAERGGTEKVTVETKAFSYFTNKYLPNIIKMDIEGSEYRIFNKDSIKDCKFHETAKQIVIEVHHNSTRDRLSDFISVFEQLNYKFTIEATTVNKKSGANQQDLLLRLFKD